MIKSKWILVFSFLFFIFISLYFSDVPFFWDGTFFSELACKFYGRTYTPFDFPPSLDNASFPCFSFYMSMIWKIFSKSLFVSHLAMLPFLIGIVWEYYKLAKKFLSDFFVSVSLLILLLEPTLVTQSIIMSMDIIPIYLFLMLLNQLLDKSIKIYPFVLPILALYSIRGMILAASLALLQLSLFNSEKRKNLATVFIKSHLPAILILIYWYIFHAYKTGWFVFAEVKNEHEKILPVEKVLPKLFFIFWKLLDFGRITLWLIFFIGLFISFKNKIISFQMKRLLLILILSTTLIIVVLLTITNPAGHHYFTLTFILLIIIICHFLSTIKERIWRNGLIILICVSLISGNFWLYPERLGNGWDSSLKVIPYFHLKEEMDEFIKEEKIDIKQIGTQFPLIADKKYSHLIDSSYFYNNVWSGPINKYNYFLFTNVINSDISNQIEETKHTWKLIKSLKSGQVYINLYKKK